MECLKLGLTEHHLKKSNFLAASKLLRRRTSRTRLSDRGTESPYFSRLRVPPGSIRAFAIEATTSKFPTLDAAVAVELVPASAAPSTENCLLPYKIERFLCTFVAMAMVIEVKVFA